MLSKLIIAYINCSFLPIGDLNWLLVYIRGTIFTLTRNMSNLIQLHLFLIQKSYRQCSQVYRPIRYGFYKLYSQCYSLLLLYICLTNKCKKDSCIVITQLWKVCMCQPFHGCLGPKGLMKVVLGFILKYFWKVNISLVITNPEFVF